MIERLAGLTIVLALAAFPALAQQLVTAARSASDAAAPGTVERLESLLDETRVLMRFDISEALACASRAADLADRLGDGERGARARALQATATVGLHGPEQASELLRAAREHLSAGAGPGDRATVALADANVHYSIRDLRQSLAALRDAIGLAEEAGDAYLRGKSLLLAISVVGWPEDAVVEAQRIVALAKEAGSAALTLEADIHVAIATQREGDVAAAREAFDSLYERAKQLGDRASAAFLASALAQYYTADDLDRCEQLARQSLDHFRRLGDRTLLAESELYLGRLVAHRGDANGGLDLCERSLANLDGIDMDIAEREVLATCVHLASLADEPEKAAEFGRRHRAVNERMNRANAIDERGALWRDSLQLRRDLRAEQSRARTELAAIRDGRNFALLVLGSTIAALLAGAGALLWRSKRRVVTINRQLQQALEDSQSLQRERAALQKNVQQIERLESLGLLAGGFAHDFNNILVGVRGNAQLLLQDPAIDDRPAMLEEIVHASERAAELCKDILSYARAAPTPKSVIDVRDVLEAVAPLAKAGLGAGVTLDVDAGEHPALVIANRSQIEQLFLNVLVNAGDAIADHGRIEVTVDYRRLDGRPTDGNWFGEFPDRPSDRIAVTVLDNGQGMDPETVRRIFDPFFTTRFAGRGLGLAAAFGILRRHDGIVEIDSEQGRGTRFTIYLPRADDELSPEEPSPEEPPRARSLGLPETGGDVRPTTILVVDDEPAVRDVARAALELDGHTVVCCPDHGSALEQLERLRDDIGLALIDVTMPDGDGSRLSRSLLERQQRLCVVMMTGHAASHVHLDDLDTPLLTKPFDLAELRRTVRQALASRAN